MNPHRDVVVVGGGQAGLAIGYYLARDGRRFTILEAAEEPAAAWRQRWDSLTLVKDDAEYIAKRIAAFHATAPAEPLPVPAVAEPAA